MKRNNRYLATTLLIIVTIGFLISSIFSESFTGRLLAALFGASMIGGIADWFGVTALFRKPLGIPFKTEIIQRSRARITEALVRAVEEELLTKEALVGKLEKIDISSKLLYYLEEQDGKKEISLLANKIVFDLLETMDHEKTGKYLESVIDASAADLKVYPLFLKATEWMGGNWNNEKVIAELADDFKDFILYPGVGTVLGGAIDSIFRRLQENSDKETAGKRLFFKLMFTIAGFSDASPSKLTARLQTEALEYLNSIKKPESIQRRKLEAWVEKNVHDFRSNPSLQEKIEGKSLELLKQASLGQLLTTRLFPYIKNAEQFKKLEQYLDTVIDHLAANFKENREDQARLNQYIKNAFIQLLDEHHGKIGQLVREKLNLFSNEMLVQMIEDKAGNDLQIIRINGSVVGGLVGAAIFLLTCWIQ